jgi:hypothetical protein
MDVLALAAERLGAVEHLVQLALTEIALLRRDIDPMHGSGLILDSYEAPLDQTTQEEMEIRKVGCFPVSKRSERLQKLAAASAAAGTLNN